MIIHKDKSHGLDDTEVMRRLRDLIKPALLIIPDASGSAEQYKALNDLGIDIVVLDHHDTFERGNNDTTIVVNNQHSEKYINKALSGAGVVWQLCRVFDDILQLDFADRYLDLVAVGLVGDVMSLASDETRFLVQEGLKPENLNSPFLQQCLKDMAFSIGEIITPTAISFYIAPMFNAVVRIGSDAEKEMLLKALIEKDATEMILSGKRGHTSEKVQLVEEALRQSTNAKSRQKTRQDKLAAKIDKVIEEEDLLKNKILILGIDDFDADQRALSGLVANKLQDTYQRPVILVFKNENRTYSGSARAPDTIEAFDNFRLQCEQTGLCHYCAGL